MHINWNHDRLPLHHVVHPTVRIGGGRQQLSAAVTRVGGSQVIKNHLIGGQALEAENLVDGQTLTTQVQDVLTVQSKTSHAWALCSPKRALF